uniref:Uncharacterized protein n=1 Tax=Arundo donax TaxID=35708 RepID=A0A0A9BRE6_ARUDO
MANMKNSVKRGWWLHFYAEIGSISGFGRVFSVYTMGSCLIYSGRAPIEVFFI